MKRAFPLVRGGSSARLNGTIARMVPRAILAFVLCIIVFHTMPTGSGSLGSAQVGSMRPNHLVHLIMFLPWGILAMEYFRRWPGGVFGRAVGCALLGLTLAAFAEGIQYLLPYRTFNPADLGMNFLGVLVGMALALLWCSGRVSLQRRAKRNIEHSSAQLSPTD